MSGNADEVRCMLIPLHEGRLLLPNSAVAEVIGYREPESTQPADPWLRGEVNWHQRPIPVVDFERLRGAPERPGSVRQRIVVCYATEITASGPLVGLVSQGIPRLLRVSRDAIEDASKPLESGSAVLMQLVVQDEKLTVPDINRIMERCATHSGTSAP
jgi:chemosensory pili system protein ChpC